MSTFLMPGALRGRGRSIALASVALVALFLIILTTTRSRTPASTAAPVTLTIPEGQAGKVGEVAITAEAMNLAEIDIAPAKPRLVEERLMVSGSIKAGSNQLAKITPTASGKAVKILVAAGDRVKVGQVLAILESAELAQAQADYKQSLSRAGALKATLDDQRKLAELGAFGGSELEESRSRAVAAERGLQESKRTLAQGQSEIVEAASQLELARNLVDAAQAELEVKKSHLKRAEELPQLVSLQQLERLRADARQAEAELRTANAGVAQSHANLLAARERLSAAKNDQPLAAQEASIRRSAVEREEKVYAGGYSRSRELVQSESASRMAQVELDAAQEKVRLLGGVPGGGSAIPLVAPIGGTVQDVGLTLGETVGTEDLAFTVVNLDEVYVELALAPSDLAKVEVGNRVEILADAAPEKPFLAELTGINSAADPVTRTVSARAKVKNPSQLLAVGSFVKANIVTDVRTERLTVPIGALQDHTGRPTLYVAKSNKDGSFEVRHVTLGTEGADWREITGGLEPGESLATHGTFYLKSEALKSSLSDGCCSIGE